MSHQTENSIPRGVTYKLNNPGPGRTLCPDLPGKPPKSGHDRKSKLRRNGRGVVHFRFPEAFRSRRGLLPGGLLGDPFHEVACRAAGYAIGGVLAGARQ